MNSLILQKIFYSNLNCTMGGDAFEGLQKLSNQQYIKYTSEIIQKLRHLCQRIQPYIPLPQKQIHGDIDFLVILKPQTKSKALIQQLKTEKFIMNKDKSIHSVYKNKQVDYFIVQNQKEFQLASFYKSYSGIGAFLGIFLPTKQIKLTPTGLYALGFQKHLKLQLLLTDQIEEILKFYGLDAKKYHEKFNSLKQLFQFLRNTRFLDEQKFAFAQKKSPTKIMLRFAEYLKQTGINSYKKVDKYDNPLEQTLKYFNKQKKYEQQFQKLKKSMQKTQFLNSKFNGTHILKEFDLKPQDLKKYKKIFHDQFQNQEAYYKYIEQNQIETILIQFGNKCGLKEKQENTLEAYNFIN